jgi:hypothetical protein
MPLYNESRTDLTTQEVARMQEIEVIGTIDQQGQLILRDPLTWQPREQVRLRITLLEEEFNPDNDSKAQLMADLKESLQQAKAGQTISIEELWDDLND